jgi:hypothetical protein
MRSGQSTPSIKTAQADRSQLSRRRAKRPDQYDKPENDADTYQGNEISETLEADDIDSHDTGSLAVGLLHACLVAQNRAEGCDDDHKDDARLSGEIPHGSASSPL